MKNFGTGPTLREACPWLKDDNARWERILEATERNSVIEGLPPLRDEIRRRLLEQFQARAASEPR